MHLHDCPNCNHGFVARKGKRCWKCWVLIVHSGEYYANTPEEKNGVFLCDKKGNFHLLEKTKPGTAIQII